MAIDCSPERTGMLVLGVTVVDGGAAVVEGGALDAAGAAQASARQLLPSIIFNRLFFVHDTTHSESLPQQLSVRLSMCFCCNDGVQEHLICASLPRCYAHCASLV